MVALAQKPVIENDAEKIDPKLLDTLMENLSSIASVFHKSPSSFVQKSHFKNVFKDRDYR
jgi:hypothetical protein